MYVFGTLLTQRRFTAANFALPRLNTPTPLDNFQTRFDGAIQLFDSGRTPLQVRGARRMASAADYETEQARQDLILRVMRAYYGVIVARENLAAAREALRTAESNEGRVRALQKAGLVVTSDRLSAQVFRARMKEREIRAANDLQLARIVLSRELGLDPAALHEPTEILAEPHALGVPLAEWEKISLSERPALRAAEMRRQAAASSRQLAKTEFGPKLGVFANFERDAETLGGLSGTNWTADARLELNLFAGGANRYRLAEAQARGREAENQLAWLRSGVRLEMRHAYLNAQAAVQRAAAARDAVEQAAESLRIVQNRYEAGPTTLTELLRAQTARLEARTGSPEPGFETDPPAAIRSSADALGGLYLNAPDGSALPLGELARVEQGRIDKNIYRKNLRPVVYVIGDVADAEESPVYAILDPGRKIAALKLLEGYRVEQFSAAQPPYSDKLAMKWDGEWHITYEVFRDLGLAFAAVLVLIYVLVVGWFHSLKTPLVIMAPIPLTLVGILPAHALAGAFFTATSMIGFIAGAGIIVRNSIILVHFIKLRRTQGMPLEQAVVDAGAVRFRPMLLTAAAVVVGSSVILFAPIFQGLAISLMAGEVASTVLSRVAVPVLYYIAEKGGTR